MDTWNTLTAIRGEGGGLDERRWRDHSKNVCAWSIDTDNSVVMDREKGGCKGWVEAGKGGESGTSVIVSPIKIKEKI